MLGSSWGITLAQPLRTANAWISSKKWPLVAYHAHWAAECALQAHAANHAKTDLERRVRYAQRWNIVCHGKEVFQFLMKRHGWPETLLAKAADPETLLATAADLTSGDASERAGDIVASDAPEASPTAFSPPPRDAGSSPWDFTIIEGSSGLSVSIVLPTGATPADLDLDVGPLRVVARCTCDGPEPLEVTLPRSVDPTLAPPAKFKKKERRIVLELPFA